MMPDLKSKGEGAPDVPESIVDGPAIFNGMSWNSEMNWDDAHLKSVVLYLRGNRSLRLPSEWKAVFPRHI